MKMGCEYDHKCGKERDGEKQRGRGGLPLIPMTWSLSCLSAYKHQSQPSQQQTTTTTTTPTSSSLVVGIDFGASKTVVSYRQSGERTIYPRPFCLHGSSMIPTAIAYTSKKPYAIGQLAQKDPNCVYWLKHILHESCIVDEPDDTMIQGLVKQARERLPTKQQETPYLVVVDFLGMLLQYFRAELEDFPHLKNLPRVYTFTIPATWSENTRMTMKKVAHLAGFGHQNAKVCFITEAEAVAVYAANEIGSDMGQFSLENEGAIVCDCGGSTIDLTAFHVEQTNPSFEYQRLTAYTSKAWGAVQLQCLAYHRVLQRQTNRSSRREGLRFIDVPFTQWAPGAFPYGPISLMDPGRVGIPLAVANEVYKELVTKIVGYIKQQIDCASVYVGGDLIKKVLLVGGLTQSPEFSDII
ncbi:hypothetical protein P170DRAFT_28139 [Aspergillus steynii IBT 23096]|uniref:Actin-like ATPase domain-containing protein n=1 Tax=Aspergillus steynii IBT 23096 TaxID=1392250 RepID=A0A2I2GPZ9_9EURO|nr:uncharacterized protein P170DRAFT_28139 [Aspergillus steynii IBT 23096]PLB54953.1 hypothetical protein P170DRAFT_28139 [Aspergillus steynii IBT 23096]